MKKEPHPQLVKLAEQARQVVESEMLFTDPLINRKKLAHRLSTNEKYLADAIRFCEGLTINDFINRLRIEHARRLIEKDQEIKVTTAALASGINTRTTLFRLSRKYYNMSPTEFRKLT